MSNVSKIHERLLFDQVNDYFECLFAKYQCGLWQGFSAQYCLIAMLEKWKKSVDKGKAFTALLTDLSKVLDFLPLDLIISKLNAYSFTYSSTRSIHSYFSDRKQGTNKV